MSVYHGEIKLQSRDRQPCFHNVTEQVKAIVEKSGIKQTAKYHKCAHLEQFRKPKHFIHYGELLPVGLTSLLKWHQNTFLSTVKLHEYIIPNLNPTFVIRVIHFRCRL